MTFMRCVVGVALSTALFAGTLAQAQTPKENFDKGQALVAKADFAAAVDLLAAAAKAEPANADFTKRYTVVRRVIDFRTKLQTEQDPKQWETIAKALRSFYLREKLNDEALALAATMHAKLNSATSAFMLAETQLATDHNAQAVKTLQAIPADKVTPAAQALLAIGYVETAKPDEARKTMAAVVVPDDAPAGTKYIVARAYAKTGDAPKAIAMLTRFFESVPPSSLEAMKTQAKAIPEFAALVSTPEFQAALQTKSKLDESKCTGGSDCNTCPVGAKCPTGDAAKKAQDAPKK